MPPDERVFRQHLEEGSFQSGVAKGRWCLLKINWPFVLIGVAAAERHNSPKTYYLRFNCENYPSSPPTAQPWDTSNDSPLLAKKWPAGGQRVSSVFRPEWKNGSCLYLPCDRISLQGHAGWRTQYPSMLWSSNGDITQYLSLIHELLKSSDYTGSRSA